MVQSLSAAFLIIASLLLATPQSFASEARDGATAFNKQDYGKAEEAFRAAVTKDPTNFDQWYNLGVSQYKQGKLNEAKESFGRAVQHPRADGKMRSLYNLGNTEAMLQQYEAAKQAYQQALSYDLNNKNIRDNLAWVEEQLKNPPQSQQNTNDQQQKNEQQDQQNAEKQQNQNEQQKSENQEQKNAQNQQQDAQKNSPEEQKAQNDQHNQRQSQNADKQQSQKDQNQPQNQDGMDKTQGQSAATEDRTLEKDEAERLLRQVEDQLGKNRVQGHGEGDAGGQNHDW